MFIVAVSRAHAFDSEMDGSPQFHVLRDCSVVASIVTATFAPTSYISCCRVANGLPLVPSLILFRPRRQTYGLRWPVRPVPLLGQGWELRSLLAEGFTAPTKVVFHRSDWLSVAACCKSCRMNERTIDCHCV